MERRRRGLWVENALGLAVLTLVSILLNAALVWVVVERLELQRRRELALSVSEALIAQIEFEGAVPLGLDRRAVQVLGAYQGTSLPVDELLVVDRELGVLASVAGDPPAGWDEGWTRALRQHTQHTSAPGQPWRPDAVVVTSPIEGGQAALRVRVPLVAGARSGLGVGFVLAFTATCSFTVALFGWALFRRNLIRPLALLREGTRRIADGDFGHQVRVDGSRELEELSLALNAMSSSLAGYRARTADQLQRLEAAYSDLRLAQDALLRSEKLAVVGRLAAGLAHEIGNPLAAVSGSMELLAQGLADPALRDPSLERELVERARRELERIQRYIRQQLDFARAGSGQVEDVAVGQVVQDALDTVRPQPGARGTALAAEVEAGLPTVRMERDKLHQVLVNLLLNAVDAARGRDGACVRLSVRAMDEGGRAGVELCCEDNGDGFSAEALARALEPFYTTKEVGRGTGLGLATCLSVVEAAGGRLELSNRPEGGARVRVWLPCTTAR